VLNFLVSQGANVSAVDKKGSTTLHKAAFNGNVQCVQVLLQKGVTVNIKDSENTTPLHNAVYNGHTEVVSGIIYGRYL
jgi:ankyrin repeat protein